MGRAEEQAFWNRGRGGGPSDSRWRWPSSSRPGPALAPALPVPSHQPCRASAENRLEQTLTLCTRTCSDHHRAPLPSACHGEARRLPRRVSSSARDPARGRHAGGAGRDRQAALADRARLRGAEAGAGARPLRGPRLARLPPPRVLVHRGLRLPGGRALALFPSRLATPAAGARAAGRLPSLQLLPAPGAARSALDSDLAPASCGGAGAPSAALPLLPASLRTTVRVQQFMTR